MAVNTTHKTFPASYNKVKGKKAGDSIGRSVKIRMEYEDWLIICFLAGIGAGTAAVNLMGTSLREQAGYVGQLYEAASRIGQGRGKEFFISVFRQRMAEIAVLWFVSLTVFSEQGFCLAAFWVGLSSSAVLSVIVCQKGVIGPFYYSAAVFPQYFFYLPAWLLAAASGARYKNRFQARAAFFSIFLTAIGIGCEAVVNPVLVRGIKIF